jgi:hypothetical protein
VTPVTEEAPPPVLQVTRCPELAVLPLAAFSTFQLMDESQVSVTGAITVTFRVVVEVAVVESAIAAPVNANKAIRRSRNFFIVSPS